MLVTPWRDECLFLVFTHWITVTCSRSSYIMKYCASWCSIFLWTNCCYLFFSPRRCWGHVITQHRGGKGKVSPQWVTINRQSAAYTKRWALFLSHCNVDTWTTNMNDYYYWLWESRDWEGKYKHNDTKGIHLLCVKSFIVTYIFISLIVDFNFSFLWLRSGFLCFVCLLNEMNEIHHFKPTCSLVLFAKRRDL